MELALNGFQHLGIPVTDLERSVAFYRRLGFEPVMSSDFDLNGDKGKMSMLQRGEMIIELYQFPPAELAEIKTRKDGHIDHMAFDVSDVDATYQWMKAEGFAPIEPAPVFLPFWKNGCRYFNIAGPDGERLEFNQIL
jgi:lactoylglutathione lyase